MNFQIAIDGPAGAGKSTVAKKVANELKFVYMDTGAMYRALGLYCVRNNIDLMDEELVSETAKKVDVTVAYVNGEQAVLCNGENVNGFIRTPEVSDAASKVSAYKKVRAKMVEVQQNLTKTMNVVMDGRDISAVVLPNAQVKIYLDASVLVRAKRRYDEMIAKGEKAVLDEIVEDVKERDYRDMHRDASPLTRVPEATFIDSSDMTIDEVVNVIINEAKAKM